MGPWECAVSKALEQQRRSMRRISGMYIFKFKFIWLINLISQKDINSFLAFWVPLREPFGNKGDLTKNNLNSLFLGK